MPDDLSRIYDLLRRHVGVHNLISSSTLESMLGMGERDVRRAVAALVRAGIPVCSSMVDHQHGYWLPLSLHEVLESVEPRLKHGRSELASAWRLKRAAISRFSGCFDFADEAAWPEKLPEVRGQRSEVRGVESSDSSSPLPSARRPLPSDSSDPSDPSEEVRDALAGLQET